MDLCRGYHYLYSDDYCPIYSHLDSSYMGSLVPPAGRRGLRLLPPEAAHGRGGGGGEERRRRRRRRLRLRDAAGEDRGGEGGLRRH